MSLDFISVNSSAIGANQSFMEATTFQGLYAGAFYSVFLKMLIL